MILKSLYSVCVKIKMWPILHWQLRDRGACKVILGDDLQTLSVRISTSIQIQSSKSFWRLLFLSNFQMGFRNLWSSPIHLSTFTFQRLCFSESHMCQQEVESLTQRIQIVSSPWVRRSLHPYTILGTVRGAWERLSTITGMGIALNVVGPGALRSGYPIVHRNAGSRKISLSLHLVSFYLPS